MKKPLWEPSLERIEKSNMNRFIRFVNEKYGNNFSAYPDLYEWSVTHLPEFWAAMWEFGAVKT